LDSNKPPEFFFDRSLGKRVAEDLRSLGWRIHRIADRFPDDAQHTDDAAWMCYGLRHNWFPLHKDGRIRGREAERRPLVEFGAPMFYLNNQQLPIAEMVRRFHGAQVPIYRAAERRRAACYAVTAHGIRRTWPDV
jgi:PIN like domain